MKVGTSGTMSTRFSLICPKLINGLPLAKACMA